jgi:leucyl-tRNA synthetase
MTEQPPFRYDAELAASVEARWQARWQADGTFQTPNPSGPLSAGFEPGRPKAYVLDFFPYPSGDGLHVGHPLGYIATDTYARFLRMTGHHVLHPFGFDAFGLPAEQYAIDTGQHPAVTTARNIATMRRQLRRFGNVYDDRRTFATTDPAYYHWTQWTFLRLFDSWYDPSVGRARPIAELAPRYAHLDDEVARRRAIDAHRLAYLSDEPVNWCPALGTVLANEEVTADGRSGIGDHPVYRRPMRQWMLRITAYADRLLADLDALDWPESVKTMQRNWIGRDGSTYRLRDWLFSRQRYWGEPFPIVYDAHGLPVALPESMLPVRLPEVDDFRPRPAGDEPVPPLARAPGWAEVELDLGDGVRTYRRELNVMPQWAGSCWYHLRYLDPTNDTHLVDPDVERYWMAPGGVDLYVGGVEQAVLHLLYARFWHKVLYDLGHVSTPEPYRRLFNQGYVLADAFTDARGRYVPAAEVALAPGGHWTHHDEPVQKRAGKMGKSLKNGVSPDEVIATYGADTLRLYEMAMGPLDSDRPWRPDDIVGVYRFLQRLWRNVIDETTGESTVDTTTPDEETVRRLHRTVKAVRDGYENLRFNTAVARLIELNTWVSRRRPVPKTVAEALILMVAPLAPHVAEELWSRLGHAESVAHQPFPDYDATLAAELSTTMPVQVDGRQRFRIEVPAGADDDTIRAAVTAHPDFARYVGDSVVRRIVVVPGRVVNVATTA